MGHFELANIVRRGLALLGSEMGATEGQMPAIGADGEVEFVNAGGGGSVPAFGVWSSDTYVTIANNDLGKLPFSAFDNGDESLLDVTDPLQPKVTADGFYVVDVQVRSNPMTLNGYFVAELILDYEEGSADLANDSRPDTDGSGPRACVGGAIFIPAGHSIVVNVTNLDGANSVHFSMHTATILKIPA